MLVVPDEDRPTLAQLRGGAVAGADGHGVPVLHPAAPELPEVTARRVVDRRAHERHHRRTGDQAGERQPLVELDAGPRDAYREQPQHAGRERREQALHGEAEQRAGTDHREPAPTPRRPAAVVDREQPREREQHRCHVADVKDARVVGARDREVHEHGRARRHGDLAGCAGEPCRTSGDVAERQRRERDVRRDHVPSAVRAADARRDVVEERLERAVVLHRVVVEGAAEVHRALHEHHRELRIDVLDPQPVARHRREHADHEQQRQRRASENPFRGVHHVAVSVPSGARRNGPGAAVAALATSRALRRMRARRGSRGPTTLRPSAPSPRRTRVAATAAPEARQTGEPREAVERAARWAAGPVEASTPARPAAVEPAARQEAVQPAEAGRARPSSAGVAAARTGRGRGGRGPAGASTPAAGGGRRAAVPTARRQAVRERAGAAQQAPRRAPATASRAGASARRAEPTAGRAAEMQEQAVRAVVPIPEPDGRMRAPRARVRTPARADDPSRARARSVDRRSPCSPRRCRPRCRPRDGADA